jgi:hypothetical protein
VRWSHRLYLEKMTGRPVKSKLIEQPVVPLKVIVRSKSVKYYFYKPDGTYTRIVRLRKRVYRRPKEAKPIRIKAPKIIKPRRVAKQKKPKNPNWGAKREGVELAWVFGMTNSAEISRLIGCSVDYVRILKMKWKARHVMKVKEYENENS